MSTATYCTESDGLSPTGEAFATNMLLEADTFKIQPINTPPTVDPSELRELRAHTRTSRDADVASSPAFAEDAAPTTSMPEPMSAGSEDDPRRYRFHSALYSAAMQADVDEVQTILRGMSEAGLAPGPAALHSLVFAHVKAGNSETALQAAAAIVSMGMAPLDETYIAIVYGLVEENKVELAEGVIMSMYDGGGTARHGAPLRVYLHARQSAISQQCPADDAGQCRCSQFRCAIFDWLQISENVGQGKIL
jgi:hypothetical protein